MAWSCSTVLQGMSVCRQQLLPSWPPALLSNLWLSEQKSGQR